MKKLVSVLSVLLMCALLLTSCAQKEAYDLYVEMNEAMLSVKSSDVTADVIVKMGTSEGDIDISMKMDMQQIARSETDIDLKMDMIMDLGEVGAEIGMPQMQMNMYFTGGWMYYDMMGQKIKMQIDLENAMEMVSFADVSAMSIDFEKEAVTNSSVKAVGENKELSFTLNGDMLGDMLNQMAGEMMQGLGMGENVSISFGDVTYTAVIGKDSLPKEEHMIFSIDMEFMVEGKSEAATAEYDMKMTNNAFNSIEAIDFPSFDDYIEIDASMMGL